jgi:hypothetical protein
MPKIDITHTVSLKNRPHPEARLIRDLDTGEAVWEGVPEPLGPVEPLPEASVEQPSADPAPPELEPEKVVIAKPKTKKLHHG